MTDGDKSESSEEDPTKQSTDEDTEKEMEDVEGEWSQR